MCCCVLLCAVYRGLKNACKEKEQLLLDSLSSLRHEEQSTRNDAFDMEREGKR